MLNTSSNKINIIYQAAASINQGTDQFLKSGLLIAFQCSSAFLYEILLPSHLDPPSFLKFQKSLMYFHSHKNLVFKLFFKQCQPWTMPKCLISLSFEIFQWNLEEKSMWQLHGLDLGMSFIWCYSAHVPKSHGFSIHFWQKILIEGILRHLGIM